MRRMDDREFFGATADGPLFRASRPGSWDSCTSPTKLNVSTADARPELLISGSPSVSPHRVNNPLDRVTDPELREIMEIVLDEDAGLIAYLRDR